MYTLGKKLYQGIACIFKERHLNSCIHLEREEEMLKDAVVRGSAV